MGIRKVRLTGGDFHVGGFDWSPDGSRIAVQRTRDPHITSFDTADLGVLVVPEIEQPVPCRQPEKDEEAEADEATDDETNEDTESETEANEDGEDDLPELRMVVERDHHRHVELGAERRERRHRIQSG